MVVVANRPYDPARDQFRVLDLLLARRTGDSADRYPPLARLRMLLVSRLWEPGRDARIWEDATGRLVGFAGLFRHRAASDWASLVSVGAQATEGSDLDAAVLDWAVARARAIAVAQPGLVLSWHGLDQGEAARIALLEDAGFVRSVVGTVQMARPLGGSLVAAAIPASFTLRPMPEPDALDAYLVPYAPVFGRASLEHRRQLMREPDYDPSLEFLLADSAGNLAAYCECSVERREWAAGGSRDGRIDWIATAPDLRQRGLGTVLLLTALARLRDAGAETARLFTESTNAPALRLYVAHRFQVVAEWWGYDLRVADAGR